MEKRSSDRLLILLVVLTSILLIDKLIEIVRSSNEVLAEDSSQVEVQSGLIPRFIDFDIGAATVRSGASHQDFIPDIPPYVLLPNSGYPLTMVNFTIPPDFASGGDFVARVLWSTISSPPCFFVLQTELVGYGPGHSAALFEPYWSDETNPSDEHIISVDQSYSTFEQIITFQSSGGFPAYAGDIMTLTLLRDAGDTNDTCADDITIRSVSLTYQGLKSYLPFAVKSP